MKSLTALSMIRYIRNKIIYPIQSSILFLSDTILIKFLRPLPKRKFVIGVTEIANNIFVLKKVLPESYSVCFTKNGYYLDNHYDFISPTRKVKNTLYHYLYKPFLLCRLTQSADVFIYFWVDGFCHFRDLDFKYLKKKKKKIITIFVGSDIRSFDRLKKFLEEKDLDSFIYYMPKEESQREEEKRRRAIMAEKYADMIITANVDQRSYFNRKTFPFLYYIDTADYLPFNKVKYENVSKPRILHFPTSTVIKGTPLVRAAIKKLRLEGYDFEYIEGQKLQHDKLVDLMKDAHVILNQFYSFVPGTFGVEALFSYTALLMSADPAIEEFPEQPDNAWIVTNYWNIYDKLKDCLDNPQQLEGYARRGFEYAMRNYTLQAARRQFLCYCREADIPFTESSAD